MAHIYSFAKIGPRKVLPKRPHETHLIWLLCVVTDSNYQVGIVQTQDPTNPQQKGLTWPMVHGVYLSLRPHVGFPSHHIPERTGEFIGQS